MFTTALLSALLVSGPALVSAHGHIKSILVDGVAHAGFNPSYAADYGSTAMRPSDNSDQGFTDYTTTKVACGSDNAGSGLETLDVTAGTTVTWQWNTWPDSHKGPSDFYLGKCPDSGCDGVAADSLDWFKIQEESFDGTAWPTDKIVSTLNADVAIPASIASGNYLLRHSLLAMHTPSAPQVYPYCVQINLKSDGTAAPAASDMTTFPAAYTTNTDFLTWDLYSGDQSLFVAPGPTVFNAGGGGGSGSGNGGGNGSTPAPSSTASSSNAAPTPSSSDSASGPSSSVAGPSASSSAAAPAPTPSGSEPSASASDPAHGPSSTASSAAPPAGTSASPAPPAGGALGGPAPAVTENNGRFEVDGGSYPDRASAVQASCMSQMNKCKDAANALPNGEVSAAFTACDTQLSTCTSASSSHKRAVVNRYAKRAAGPRF